MGTVARGHEFDLDVPTDSVASKYSVKHYFVVHSIPLKPCGA